jgi:hypothetical protein
VLARRIRVARRGRGQIDSRRRIVRRSANGIRREPLVRVLSCEGPGKTVTCEECVVRIMLSRVPEELRTLWAKIPDVARLYTCVTRALN